MVEPPTPPYGQRGVWHKSTGGPGAVTTGLKIGKGHRTAGNFPPDTYGAGGWSEGQDGLWTTATRPRKYAIKGPDSDQWMVAHTLNSRDMATPEEIHGMLRQLDYLHGKFPLHITPEIVVGNFTGKGINRAESAGFTISTPSGRQRDREVLFMRKNLDVYGTFPIGPHTIYVNTPKERLVEAREHSERTKAFLGPTYGDSRPFEYTVTHEFGHLREWQQIDTPAKYIPVMKELVGQGHQPVSRYGRYNANEALAESFADWVHSNGFSTNTFTSILAHELGWPLPDATGR
jgi:hypothetical protein